MSPTPPATPGLHKNACSLCARRKVKCDKKDPCSNCLKAQTQCSYETPAPPRPRKRAADQDLLARLAQYEDLMRKHNVDFTQHANIWVPCELEGGLKASGSPALDVAPQEELCLWSNLSPELKYPSVQNLRHKDDPFLHPTPSLQLMLPDAHPKLHELHPEPRHIYRFWQIFVETVNPLTKIIHVPTLQQRIMDASWDLVHIPKPLVAILFAVYTNAVTSMSSDDCQASIGASRDTLLTRYRTATVQALMEAEFLTSREFEVLQALVLFLLADPESELCSTLTATAIRLGQKMGLHRENADSRISFFEKEMRIRLWWQLRGLDARVRAVSIPGIKLPTSECDDVRPPLNVNDADLHPNMTEPPAEHKGPTEMLCVLMKYQVTHWLRSSPKAAKFFENISHGPMKGKISMESQDEAINELEGIYQEKFLCHLDKRIPLHGVTDAMARLAIARLRFKLHHPRGRAMGGKDVYLTKKEGDLLFDSAVTLLELSSYGIRSKFSSHLFTHLTHWSQMDAYIYILSELRCRCTGDQVMQAWKLVEELYTEHPEVMSDTENALSRALGDLTLQAWEAHRKEVALDQAVPPYLIQLLWSKRNNELEQSMQAPSAPDVEDLGGLGLIDDNNFNWEYWDDLLRL
ncbi:hypothetical protein LCI18_006373 [Fusarium solani-melongenae]|uniref:Uncharacterized protein n=1 Tax=Fusarium solani subsp. cucurbitae TaxID=2747967 RepID=A0ACD3Z2F1_FUSSC|nr:hypothetical protein LCI18_006373 [Fusarium solani-melongenae]